jgi:hypothetical protein
MTKLVQLWRGELSLFDAFWNWAVIGGVAVNAVTSVAFLALAMQGWMLAAFVAGYGLSLPYNIFASVGVWRSAGRYPGDRRWADLARAVTLAGMVLLSFT